PVMGGEGIQIGGVAVVGRDDFAGAGNVKMDGVVCQGYHPAFFINDHGGDVEQILAVGADFLAVGREDNFGRGFGGLYAVLGPAFAVLIGYNFKLAGLIFHVVPFKTVFVLAFMFPAKGFAV